MLHCKWSFYAGVNLRVCSVLPVPTITAQQPARRKREIHLKPKYCSYITTSSVRPRALHPYQHTPPSSPSLSPSHALWQSPPIIILLSSLVPRPKRRPQSPPQLSSSPLVPATSFSPSSNSFSFCHLSCFIARRRTRNSKRSLGKSLPFWLLLELLRENWLWSKENAFSSFRGGDSWRDLVSTCPRSWLAY